MKTFAKFARPASILLAATLGFTLGACAHSQFRIEKVCNKFCKRVVMGFQPKYSALTRPLWQPLQVDAAGGFFANRWPFRSTLPRPSLGSS